MCCRNWVLDATYTGSKGTHLASDRVNYMQIPEQYAYLGSLLNRAIDDPAVVAAGLQAALPELQEPDGQQRHARTGPAIWPQYSGVATGGMKNHSGNSTYNAMILKASKRFSGGLSMVANYTFSKLLTDADSSEPWIAGVVGSGVGAGAAQNQSNRGVEKSYGVLDLPHMFKLTGVTNCPSATGASSPTPAWPPTSSVPGASAPTSTARAAIRWESSIPPTPTSWAAARRGPT